MRTLEIDLEDLLDLVNCADDYGWDHSILLASLGDMARPVTDEEIQAYASGFLSAKSRAKGYGEEDAEDAIRNLTDWRDKYALADETSRVSPAKRFGFKARKERRRAR